MAACSGLTLTKSAENLSAVGEQFVASGKQLDDAYRAKIITEKDYQIWRAFAPNFRLGYSQATQALDSACIAAGAKVDPDGKIDCTEVGGVTTPQKTAQLIVVLKNQLLNLLLKLYAPAAKGVK